MNSINHILKTNIRLGSKVQTPDGVGWVKKMSIDHDGERFIEESADCFVVYEKPVCSLGYGGTYYAMTYKLSQVRLYGNQYARCGCGGNMKPTIDGLVCDICG